MVHYDRAAVEKGIYGGYFDVAVCYLWRVWSVCLSLFYVRGQTVFLQLVVLWLKEMCIDGRELMLWIMRFVIHVVFYEMTNVVCVLVWHNYIYW